MMTLHEMIENLFSLLNQVANTGALLPEEEKELDELTAVWYNYYEKDI